MELENKNGIEETVQEVRATIRKTKKSYFLRTLSLSLMMMIVLMLSFVTLLYSPAFSSDAVRFVEKTPIKKRLSTVIKNGGSLDIVKHVFEVREYRKPQLFKEMDAATYYTDKTPLSVMLNDLCVDYLEADPFQVDTSYYIHLVGIIKENQYHNPFDNLEDTQMSYFESLRVKSGEGYDLIQSDVVKIATELSHKNQLVSKYLNKSNVSFVMSLVALCFTIILSLIQIIQSSKMNSRLELFQRRFENKRTGKGEVSSSERDGVKD